MGMFDYVRIKCPNCGLFVEEQSKAGPCELKRFTIPGNAPLAVIADMQYDGARGRLQCLSCNSILELHVQHIVTVMKKESDEYEDE